MGLRIQHIRYVILLFEIIAPLVGVCFKGQQENETRVVRVQVFFYSFGCNPISRAYLYPILAFCNNISTC